MNRFWKSANRNLLIWADLQGYLDNVQKSERSRAKMLGKLDEVPMKDDAFDDVHAPFDYKEELKKARDALDEKVREYVSRKWEFGYRELAKRFNISTGTLVAIAKGLKKKPKPGPKRRKAEGDYM